MTNDWTEEVIAEKLAKGEITIHPDSTYKPFGDAQDKPPMPPNRGKGQTLPSDPTPDTPSTVTRRKTRARQHHEKDLEQFVHNMAKKFNLLYYHTHRSKFSEPGFLDCVIIGLDMLVVELKDTGKNPTPAQQRWLDAYDRIGVPTRVWRPEDKDEIIKTLAGLAGFKVLTEG